MGLIQWAISSLGSRVPIHIAWFLGWVCAAAAALFMVGHAIYVGALARPRKFAANDSPEVLASIRNECRGTLSFRSVPLADGCFDVRAADHSVLAQGGRQV